MNVQEAVKAIEYRPGKPLTTEFNIIINQPERSVPLLLPILDFAQENYQTMPDKYMGHVFAIFLLAMLREEKAFSKIIDLLHTMDHDYKHHLFNDEIESMPNVLASTFDGNLSLLKSLVEKESVYEFSRVAALDTYLALWKYHKITRDQLVSHFKSFLNNEGLHQDGDMLYWVIEAAMGFYPEELLNDIRMAFYYQFDNALFKGENFLTAKRFEEDFAKGKEYVLKTYFEKKKFHLIDDIEFEMTDWDVFSPERDWSQLLMSKTESEDVSNSQERSEFDADGERALFNEDEPEEITEQETFNTTYGHINRAGLEELQGTYESYSLLRAVESVDQVRYCIDNIRNDLLKLHGPIFALVEGGSNDGHYNLHEDGEVWNMAISLRWQLDECIEHLENSSAALEPIEKLIPEEEEV